MYQGESCARLLGRAYCSGAENPGRAAEPPAGGDMGGWGAPSHPLSKRPPMKSILFNRRLVECRVALRKARTASVFASTQDALTIDCGHDPGRSRFSGPIQYRFRAVSLFLPLESVPHVCTLSVVVWISSQH